jgi:hypothetical protein
MENPMHQRFLAFLLAMGIAIGGWTPAMSAPGCACVAAVGCPTESSGTAGDRGPDMPMPCKAMSEQCMTGCIVLLGLPSAIQTAQVDSPALRYRLVSVDMSGRTPKPELAPPILAA